MRMVIVGIIIVMVIVYEHGFMQHISQEMIMHNIVIAFLVLKLESGSLICLQFIYILCDGIQVSTYHSVNVKVCILLDIKMRIILVSFLHRIILGTMVLIRMDGGGGMLAERLQ